MMAQNVSPGCAWVITANVYRGVLACPVEPPPAAAFAAASAALLPPVALHATAITIRAVPSDRFLSLNICRASIGSGSCCGDFWGPDLRVRPQARLKDSCV